MSVHSYPSNVELRDMLIACADEADKYPTEPAAALAAGASVINSLWPTDVLRRYLTFRAFCEMQIEASVSERFTLAAYRVSKQLTHPSHTKDLR
jgi:hypothetical protein